MSSRRLGRAVAVLALLPLAGCGLSGEVFVEADVVTIDLTARYSQFEGSMGPPCEATNWPPHTMSISHLPAAPGEVSCRIQGTLDAVDVPPELLVARSDETVFVRVPPQALLGGSPAEQTVDLDLTFHFPGQVIASSGSTGPLGTSVHWADSQFLANQGLDATARLTPGAPRWLVPALAGLGWGATLGMVFVRLTARTSHD